MKRQQDELQERLLHADKSDILGRPRLGFPEGRNPRSQVVQTILRGRFPTFLHGSGSITQGMHRTTTFF